jgi:hypothetical protein
VTRLLATYPSSHAALRAERDLLERGLAVELVPVPRQVRADCGFCLLADAPEADAAFQERLETLRASGARELWRVASRPGGPGPRKENSYERIP